MVTQILILIASLAVITFGADLLVRGAVTLAKRAGLSSFFIGLTLVGFGTSTPELGASVTAALRGSTEMAVGNVVGSNILNICLILGVTAIIRPVPVRVLAVRREAYLVIFVAMVPWLAWLTLGRVTRVEGAMMILGLALYVWRGYTRARRDHSPEAEAVTAGIEQSLERPAPGVWMRPGPAALLVLVGMVMLGGGSYFLVDSATLLARRAGISELVIGLTVIAMGTSAPELITSLVAALRRQADVSVGNIMGSNIFNILGILGVTAMIQPQTIPAQVRWLDGPVMLISSVALLPIALSAARISRTEGVILLAGYITYGVVLFTLAQGWFPQVPA
jgi:cation:H+ antiporter